MTFLSWNTSNRNGSPALTSSCPTTNVSATATTSSKMYWAFALMVGLLDSSYCVRRYAQTGEPDSRSAVSAGEYPVRPSPTVSAGNTAVIAQ